MQSEQHTASGPRLFCAIELSDLVRARVSEVAGLMEPHMRGLRWVPSENLHVTLRFLGNFPENRIDSYVEWMKKASRYLPLVLEVGGVGGFPSPGSARVIWLGASDRSERIQKVYNVLDEAAERCGLSREGRRYNPHITVARTRRPVRIPAGLIEDLSRDRMEMEVGQIVLYQSILSEDGARYGIVERVGPLDSRTTRGEQFGER